jgi:hypothetical protein
MNVALFVFAALASCLLVLAGLVFAFPPAQESGYVLAIFAAFQLCLSKMGEVVRAMNGEKITPEPPIDTES